VQQVAGPAAETAPPLPAEPVGNAAEADTRTLAASAPHAAGEQEAQSAAAEPHAAPAGDPQHAVLPGAPPDTNGMTAAADSDEEFAASRGATDQEEQLREDTP
jgi:hypothetical protein